MFQPLFVLALFFFAQTAEPAIFSPQAGEVLRGKIQIVGDANLENFVSAEISFSYAGDANRRFPIADLTQLPADQNLAVWDTSLVTDGDYDLHLRVFLADGTWRETTVSGLRIRNDEIPATEISAPQAEQTATATAVPPSPAPLTPTPIFPTPTNLPPNPATLAPGTILLRFAQGGLIAVLAVLFLSLVLRSRKD